MSKKKFKKKKNKKHSQVYVAPRPTVSAAPVAASTASPDAVAEMAPETIEEEVVKPTSDAIIPAEDEAEYAYVRRDVKKILIVMSSVIALLIIAFIISNKTSAFNSMGNWLYNTLNIQTQ